MATVDEDLTLLESDIRRLKIEYEQFFGGGRPRPPSDTQWRVEQMIKRYADRTAEINFAQRFRYNNLAQTYAKYQDMWRKKLMQKEGSLTQHHFGAAAKAIEAERARRQAQEAETVPTAGAHAVAAGSGSSPDQAPALFSMSFSNPATETEKLETLYQKLQEARREAGEGAGGPSLKDFEKFVRQKTDDFKKKGCREVEYTVSIEGGRVKLKARVPS
jgi:hypothetical protein